MIPYIHILDCSKIEVLLKNKNYEHSEVVKDQDGTHRGYKIGVLRGIVGDAGVLEEIRWVRSKSTIWSFVVALEEPLIEVRGHPH